MRNMIRKSVAQMKAYVPGEQASGPDLVKLNTNENPYPPSPRIAEFLSTVSIDRLRLYPDPVCSELRRELGNLHGCGPEQIFVGNGSDEVLALSLRAFVERDGTVGFFDPSYSLYPVLAAIEELSTRPVLLREDYQWSMPEDYNSSIFLLTNPNAPTSLTFPGKRIKAFCERTAGVVVTDEAYGDFCGEKNVALALCLDNVLVVRTLSKSYALAGIRLGYAVGPPELIQALYKIKDSYNVSWMTQKIARIAIQDQDYLQTILKKIIVTRSRISRALTEKGFEVFPSSTNFLWIRPRGNSAKSIFEGLREQKILVRHFPGPRTEAFLRVTVGTDEQMDQFLAGLDRVQPTDSIDIGKCPRT